MSAFEAQVLGSFDDDEMLMGDDIENCRVRKEQVTDGLGGKTQWPVESTAIEMET